MINFQIRGQILRGTFPAIIAGSKGYIRAKFNFSEHWLGTNKTAYFKHSFDGTPVAVSLDINDECDVPDIVVAEPGKLFVSAEGRNSQNVVLITTCEAQIPILPSGHIDGTGIVVSPETQAKLDRRRAAMANTSHGNAVQTGKELFIPASICFYPWQDTEPEAVRVQRSRIFSGTLDVT